MINCQLLSRNQITQKQVDLPLTWIWHCPGLNNQIYYQHKFEYWSPCYRSKPWAYGEPRHIQPTVTEHAAHRDATPTTWWTIPVQVDLLHTWIQHWRSIDKFYYQHKFKDKFPCSRSKPQTYHLYNHWVAGPVFVLFSWLYQYRMQCWTHYKHYSIGTADTNGYLWESKYHWGTFGHDYRNSLFEGLTIDLTQPYHTVHLIQKYPDYLWT